MRHHGAVFGNHHIEPEDSNPMKKSPWLKELSPLMLGALSKLDSSDWRTADEIKIRQGTLKGLVLRRLADRRGIFNGGSTSQGRQSPIAKQDNQYRLTKKGRRTKEEAML